MAIEAQSFADGAGIGVEAAAPKAVADQDGSRTVEGLLFGGKFPSERGWDAPDLKKRGETQARVTFSGSGPVDSETSSV